MNKLVLILLSSMFVVGGCATSSHRSDVKGRAGGAKKTMTTAQMKRAAIADLHSLKTLRLSQIESLFKSLPVPAEVETGKVNGFLIPIPGIKFVADMSGFIWKGKQIYRDPNDEQTVLATNRWVNDSFKRMIGEVTVSRLADHDLEDFSLDAKPSVVFDYRDRKQENIILEEQLIGEMRLLDAEKKLYLGRETVQGRNLLGWFVLWYE